MRITKYDIAISWFEEIDNIISSYLEKPLQVESKSSPKDLVTQVDKAVEHYISTQIQKYFPDDVIVGEENHHPENYADKNVWFIDPIDGTNNFVKMRDDFCILMAYYEKERGLYAFIYDFNRKDLYSAIKEKGAFKNDQRIEEAKRQELQEGLISSSLDFKGNRDFYYNLEQEVFGLRVYGCGGLEALKVFNHQLIASLNHGGAPWDMAPVIIMAQELGYQVVDYSGKRIEYPIHSDWMLAHPKVIEKIIPISKTFKFK